MDLASQELEDIKDVERKVKILDNQTMLAEERRLLTLEIRTE